jgi:hypothetical protein
MDMYGCAIGMVNFIKPDLGENVYDLATYKYDEDFSDDNRCDASIKGHKVKPEKKSNSFFDKLDDM